MTTHSRIEAEGDLLLIGGGFFGYAREIIAALERRGRRVVWYEDRPSLDTLTKSLIRLAPAAVKHKSDAYFARIVSEVRDLPIKDVLVIKGEAFSCDAIGMMRSALPDARFTLYFWDSYRNMPVDSPRKVAMFDRVFTFDPEDAKVDSRLTFRPLFYLPEYANLPGGNDDIDLLFIGTVHSDRYAVLRRLAASLPTSLRFDRVLYFPSPVLFAARRILDPAFWDAKRDEFTFKPLNKFEIQSLISRTRAVVDIERTVQCGLTMRAVEVFGAGKKLITTNTKVADTDMFQPSNIAIIDRKQPKLPEQFLREKYVRPSPELLARYSLEGWLDDVLGNPMPP